MNEGNGSDGQAGPDGGLGRAERAAVVDNVGMARPVTTHAVLDVYLNDKRLCRAGVGATGVLNAIVSWVKLEGEAAAEARRLGAPLEEARLHVGGLAGDTHRRWTEHALTTGDRVNVQLSRAARWDPARRQKREALAARGRQERVQTTQFLNVDLDLYATEPLDQLVAAFGKNVLVLYVGKERRRYCAHLELPTQPRDPERALRRFVDRVVALPPAAKRLWRRAQRREFNVGIQAAAEPHRFEWHLSPATLQAVAGVNARIGTTVYGASGHKSL